MPTYMSLINYTQKGIENMKESPERLDVAKQVYKSMGAELTAFYLCLGRFDAVVIGESPDDETAMKLAIMIGGAGAVRTESFRIFNENEYRKMIEELP